MLTIFDYDFMRNAFAAATIVAVLAGIVGYFLVLRSQTFAGHALAHVGFTGATGAVLVGLSPLWGLVLMTVGAGVGMGFMGEKLAERDVAIGLVLAFALALGLLFLHFFTAYATQATTLLFGNVFAVDTSTIWTLLALATPTLALLAVISRPLLFASLQPELAEAKGVPVRLYGILFLTVVALTTAECAQIVGVLLVFALMVGPAATAQQLTTSVTMGILVAAILALLEAWFGIALAFYTDWPASFWITALSVGAYLLSVIGRRLRPAAA
ncbi:MAG: metal ABC transporter permease [Methylovirgula sp.]|jgi:zinc/manganese transport system permease protein